jgi:antitoxin CptB
MKNKKNLINQIIYRSTHRGTKEMDILLGNFVKKYINNFNNDELSDLDTILNYDDKILYQWYFEKNNNKFIKNNKIMKMLKEFKL